MTPQIGLRSRPCLCSWLTIDVGGPSSLLALPLPGMVTLGAIIKQVEQDLMSK